MNRYQQITLLLIALSGTLYGAHTRSKKYYETLLSSDVTEITPTTEDIVYKKLRYRARDTLLFYENITKKIAHYKHGEAPGIYKIRFKLSPKYRYPIPRALQSFQFPQTTTVLLFERAAPADLQNILYAMNVGLSKSVVTLIEEYHYGSLDTYLLARKFKYYSSRVYIRNIKLTEQKKLYARQIDSYASDSDSDSEREYYGYVPTPPIEQVKLLSVETPALRNIYFEYDKDKVDWRFPTLSKLIKYHKLGT